MDFETGSIELQLKSTSEISVSSRILISAFLSCFLLTLSGAKFASAEPAKLANSETFRIASEMVGDEFFIKVAYPRDYASSSKRYPVLYVTDAETNFGALQYVVQRLAKDELIPELIVVGIAYDTSYEDFYRLRARDLRPSIPDDPDFDLGGRPDEGRAEQFAEFLRHELFPRIDAKYRTIEGDRAYYGHSYGGLFGVWNLMYEADLFNRYVILSPSLWWGELWWGRPRVSHGYHILPTRAATDGTPEKNARVFVASGELEPRIDELQADWVKAIRPLLDPTVEMKDIIYENETHRTIFGRGVMDGLRHVYSDGEVGS